jgi:hypothetical protein
MVSPPMFAEPHSDRSVSVMGRTSCLLQRFSRSTTQHIAQRENLVIGNVWDRHEDNPNQRVLPPDGLAGHGCRGDQLRMAIEKISTIPPFCLS